MPNGVCGVVLLLSLLWVCGGSWRRGLGDTWVFSWLKTQSTPDQIWKVEVLIRAMLRLDPLLELNQDRSGGWLCLGITHMYKWIIS
jgi:hypothetical protein